MPYIGRKKAPILLSARDEALVAEGNDEPGLYRDRVHNELKRTSTKCSCTISPEMCPRKAMYDCLIGTLQASFIPEEFPKAYLVVAVVATVVALMLLVHILLWIFVKSSLAAG